jgi:hypothetical protein
VVPEPGSVLLPGSNEPLSQGEELGRHPHTPMLILRYPTHDRGSSHSFLLIVITVELLRCVRKESQSQTFPYSSLPQ